jgi:hypothetical protein
MATLLPLQHRSECYINTAKDISRIQSIEKRYLRTAKDCTRLDHIMNGDIRKELEIIRKQNR